MVFVLGFFLVKRLLRPIDAIKQTIQGVNSSNPYKNIELPPGSEFGELTGSLNQAFGRMQETVDRERQIITEASHELRGPMTVLQGEAELALRRSRTAEEYEKTIRILSHESAHLSEMVNKLFLVTKLENAPTLTNPETVNLSDFLTELAPAFKTLCDKRGLPFKMNIEPNIKLTGERFKLRELFYNLVDNAAKFNRPGGEVAVSLKMEGNYARVDVRDTGIGIKPENMEKLFQRFFRIDKDDATGAGLGLVICQKIAELHHGSITVVSKYGKGSTFSVLLPVIE
jgi:signal transduction histidine kinase